MIITKEWLVEKSACSRGVEWFDQNYPEGGEYQTVLNKLDSESLDGWAGWLLREAGPAGDVLEIAGNLEIETNLFFAGDIKVSGFIKVAKNIRAGGSIRAGTGIEAGRYIEAGGSIESGKYIKAGMGIEAGENIKAGWNIEAGENIKAGWNIEAGWNIKVGEDCSIYAGLRPRISQKAKCGLVIAKKCPENLMLGTFQIKK